MKKERMLKLFCQKCGTRCDIKTELRFYDRDDGHPVNTYYATCPNVPKKWWQVNDGHTNYFHAGGYYHDGGGEM